MPSISFTQLEVQKKVRLRNVDYYDLIMNFDVQPVPKLTEPVNLQYAIYDEQNQIIDTMVLGYRKYPIGSGVYPHFTTTSKNIRVEAWLTGNTLVRRYNILTTIGAQEFNKISNITTRSLNLGGDIGTGFIRGAGATLQKETTQKTGGFEVLPEAAAEEMLTRIRTDTSIKQNFVNMRITKNDKIQGRINFTALGFNEFFKAGQTVTNIFIIKDINGAELGMFPESYLKFGQSETLDMIEHRDILGFSAYNQNELIIESYVWTNDYSVALAPMIKQKIVKEAPTPEPTPEEVTPEEAIDLDFNGVSTPVTTQGGEEILITEPTEPAKPTKPAEALPIGFTGIIAALVVLGGLFSWRNR